MPKHQISRADIMTMQAYAEIRAERRRQITRLKKNRRVAVGPDATFYFESYQTMWHQIHEMLYIEGGGEAQIDDELKAYNPLIPNGAELVATLMFEIDEPVRRAALLARLGGVEDTVSISFGDHHIAAVPEADIARTSAAGKASAIQFLHFPLDGPQIAAMGRPGARIVLAIGHPEYAHMTVLSDPVRQALCGDFDEQSAEKHYDKQHIP